MRRKIGFFRRRLITAIDSTPRVIRGRVTLNGNAQDSIPITIYEGDGVTVIDDTIITDANGDFESIAINGGTSIIIEADETNVNLLTGTIASNTLSITVPAVDSENNDFDFTLNSYITLKSSGADPMSPAVGDMLYLDLNYVSAAELVQDCKGDGTQIRWYRDGVLIPQYAYEISTGVFQQIASYVVTKDDVGAILSAQVDFKEQGVATAQATVSATCDNAATGSAVTPTLGDLQATHAMVMDFTKGSIPYANPYVDDETRMLWHKNLNGTGADLYTRDYSRGTNYVSTDGGYVTTGNDHQLFLRKPLKNISGTGCTLFFKGKIKDVYHQIVGKFGPLDILSIQGVNGKLRTTFDTPNGSTPYDTMVSVIFRISDTLFTDRNSNSVKSAITISDGTTEVDYGSVNNVRTALTADNLYGIDRFRATDPNMFFHSNGLKSIGIAEYAYTNQNVTDTLVILNSL